MSKEEQLTNERIFEIEKSYMTKEEIISLLQNIEFLGVERCDIRLITGYIADYKTGEVKTLSKNIEID